MLDALQAVAGSTVRWLTLGRDVVVRGDTGSGRSTVLAAVARSGERARLGTVLVDWHDLSVRALPAAGPSRRTGRTGEEVVDDLVADLGPRGALLVDDLDRLDDPTLDVLVRVLRRSDARFVGTTSGDVARTERPALARLVAGRAPAEVRIPPLGYQAMVRLVTGRLGGPPDGALASSVTAWSAGNPAVAAALVDAAQFAGAVELRDDTWTTVGDLDRLPLDAVAHLLVTGLPAGAQDALEVLSVLGPARAEVVHRMVPAGDLALLTARTRVVSVGGDRGDLLAVSPPALARAVRGRLSEARRAELAAVVVAETGDRDLPLPTVRTGLTDMILAPTGEHLEAYWQWAAQLTGLVHERAVVEEASARSGWEECPRVPTALPYLHTLLRRPATERARDVFEGTVRSADEPAEQRALFELLMLKWRIWQSRAAAHPFTDPPPGPEEPAGLDVPLVASDAAVRAAVAGAHDRDDDELLRLIALPGPAAEEPWRTFARMNAVAALLEAGRYELVLRLTEGVTVPSWLPGEAGHTLSGLRALALLLADRVADAEAFARARLEASYDALDLAGIRVHSVTLAHALTVSGHWVAAWRVLSTALRLGPPGPLGSPFHRRTLTLATMLASFMENADVADLLLAELRQGRPLHQPAVAAMEGIAEAYVLVGQSRHEEADALLWRAGDRSLAAARPMPALEYWALRVGPSTPDQIAQMRALSDRVPLPLFAPLVELHAALAGTDLDALDRAVRAARLEIVPGIAPRVLAVVDQLRRARGLPPLEDAEADDLLGPRLAEALRVAPAVHRSSDVLSDREHEVAVLAADGLTNREIAERLHLSPRTVENHVHRALRKLGVTSRSRLGDAAL